MNKNFIIVLLFLLFCFSLFKNISYPLIWNDESETVIMGTRVLSFGYPKVHDGKNVIFQPSFMKPLVGYNEKLDATIYVPWANYYFATIGVTLAKFTNDIYWKSALVRIPYAAIALAGLVIFIFSFSLFFQDKESFKWFAILFLFVELFSVSLVLHMREARYYSLIIFICSCFMYIYIRRSYFKKIRYYKYSLLFFIILTLAFHINFATFTVLVLLFGLDQLIRFVLELRNNKQNNPTDYVGIFKSLLKESVPVIAAGLLALPFIQFFELFKTSKALSDFHHFTFDVYKGNIKTIFHFFTDLEFLYTALFIKAIVLLLLYVFGNNKISAKQRPVNSNLISVSFLLLCFSIVYILMIARIPYYIFARYIIVVQVVITLMMVVDLFVIAEYLNKFVKKENIKKTSYLLFSGIALVYIYNSRNKMDYIKGHIYELTHQYKGPLDYIIPYIKDNFKNTDNLIIATNYEEYSYMYYLNSKVIIGFSNNNIEEDIKNTPDIIMYRKTWGTNPKVFNDFMQKAKYQKVSFPVYDYPVNNIPELDFAIKHLFKTKFASNEQEKVDVFVRIK